MQSRDWRAEGGAAREAPAVKNRIHRIFLEVTCYTKVGLDEDGGSHATDLT